MANEFDSVNALVEQKAAELKAASENSETPEQIAAKAAAAAGATETPEQIEAKETAAKAATQETPEEKAAKEAAADPVELQKKIDALQKALDEKNNRVDKTPEQIKKDEEVYQAKLKAYAVENDLMKNEDLQRYDNVKASEDEALVFDSFAAEVKDEILEELGDDASEEEIIAAIRKEFESEYPLNSKSEKVRARAEAKLKKAAGEIRSPLESSFNTAKTRFDDEQSVRSEYPKYQEAVNKVVVVPDKIPFYKEGEGEDAIEIQVEVSEKDKKEILVSLQNIIKDPENFILHKNGKTEEVQNKIKSELEYQLWKRLGDTGKKAMAEKLIEVGHSRGLAKGSDTGAKNSFATNQGGEKKDASASAVSAKQQVIDSTRK